MPIDPSARPITGRTAGLGRQEPAVPLNTEPRAGALGAPGVYIRSAGKFLPGEPVDNADVEDYLGKVYGHASRGKAVSLRQNGIRQRHYAIDRRGQAQYTVAQMAAHAIRDAFSRDADYQLMDTDYLAVSGSFGDRILPGLASPVHHELKIPDVEIASFQSVCGSAAMALKSAFLQVKAGEKQQAVVSGSEFVSRIMRGSYLEPTPYADPVRGITDMGVEFLRWTLSDGAGAVVLAGAPGANGRSLRIDWIDIVSYADRFDVCMQMGGLDTPWPSSATPVAAAQQAAFCLYQDFRILRDMFPVWVERLQWLMQTRRFDTESVDWYLCHFSSCALGREVQALMQERGCLIPEERWFTNLKSKGNTGSAAIFIMLEELLNEKELVAGQQILLCVPESGWGLVAHAMLTVV